MENYGGPGDISAQDQMAQDYGVAPSGSDQPDEGQGLRMDPGQDMPDEEVIEIEETEDMMFRVNVERVNAILDAQRMTISRLIETGNLNRAVGNRMYKVMRNTDAWISAPKLEEFASAIGVQASEIISEAMTLRDWVRRRSQKMSRSIRRSFRKKKERQEAWGRTGVRHTEETKRLMGMTQRARLKGGRGGMVEINRENLRNAMTLMGITGKDLADRIGVSRSLIQWYITENKKRAIHNMPRERVEKIASVLGLDAKVFIKRVIPPPQISPQLREALNARGKPNPLKKSGDAHTVRVPHPVSMGKSALMEVERAIARGADVVVVVVKR